MRPAARLLVAVPLVAALVATALPAAAADSARWTPADMLKIKGVSQVEVSPAGDRVAYVVATAVMTDQLSVWRSHIHLAGVDGTGAFQLTSGEQSATSPAWSPDGATIVFLSSRPIPAGTSGLAKVAGEAAGAKKEKEGDAPNNLWRISVRGGEAEPLTDVKSSIAAFRFSPDGKQLACLMADPKTPVDEANAKAKRDARVVDREFKRTRLYSLALEPNAEGARELRRRTEGELHIPPSERSFDWSPDGASIVFAHQPTPNADDWRKQDISLIELASGKLTPLAKTKAAESQPTFSPDGKLIAYTVSDDEVRWAGASRIRLARPTGEVVSTLAETHDSRPTLVGFTADSQKVLISETHKTVTRLSSVPVDGTAVVDLSPADQMVVAPSLNAKRTHIGFVSEASDRPPEAFTSALPVFQARQASNAQQLPKIPLGKTEVVTWRSFDDRQIEGLLTLPPGHDGKQRVPLLLLIHGGPAGVFTQGCIVSRSPYPVAAFASRGWAVLRPNPRGSSGYGRDFRFANQKDWGGGDFRDNMAGVDAMIDRGIADSQKLGVMGWSYGGYMTSWTITQTNRFKAASVGAAVTNLVSFTGTADIHGFLPDYFGGEFWEQGELWRARSPVMSAHKAITPTLIQHGDADVRVPVSQGYEFYQALERKGTKVEMVVYPRQPHGLQEPALQQDAMQRNLDWFAKWLE